MKNRKFEPCPYCGGEPELIRVGYMRELFMYCCSQCGMSTANINEARATRWGARRIWNKRAREIKID